ncbi:MAG: hypothetical protein KJ057_03355 [Phycisphaerae bacterium]|nr:MAG: SocA family protein [Phycisphaerae bacterium]MBE7457689.1 hypothetical protein [Planctomycetia bacterium]MCK6463794.1 hypothetical protein [Phycisphaerae bacterium]MCL4717491.1 hypothetical protein [Phycisphaerae bacterium]NUQ07634.1 hypothetical protein [Phycisphaerae bacterium]
MNRLQREVILIKLIQSLRQHGSWCGETHVQKATYLLQGLAGAETGFDFILYKHGPYSFELSDELSAMRADGLISLRVQTPGYGPTIATEAQVDALLKRFPKTIRRHQPLIEFVAKKLGDKNVGELERLATAFYVACGKGGFSDTEIGQRVNQIKPHVEVNAAIEAARMIRKWKDEAARIPPDEPTT